MTCFYVFWNDQEGLTILQSAALCFIDHAVDRLLDLKLIDCFFDPNLKRFVPLGIYWQARAEEAGHQASIAPGRHQSSER